jgi:hypothetical protein
MTNLIQNITKTFTIFLLTVVSFSTLSTQAQASDTLLIDPTTSNLPTKTHNCTKVTSSQYLCHRKSLPSQTGYQSYSSQVGQFRLRNQKFFNDVKRRQASAKSHTKNLKVNNKKIVVKN